MLIQNVLENVLDHILSLDENEEHSSIVEETWLCREITSTISPKSGPRVSLFVFINLSAFVSLMH